MMQQQNYINHIALVLDASLSMRYQRDKLIEVADAQIRHLAQRSKELDQETRVTVYTFNDNVQCTIYDKDVLRLPSIAQLYKIGGNTALIDAAMQSQNELAQTGQLYGDHAFLTFILTDGEENASRKHASGDLRHKLEQLPGNWTVAVLVPDQKGKHEAKKFGFPADNIAIWDATSADGMEEAGSIIRTATDNYMTNRATGVRGSRSLFSTSGDTLNKVTVHAAGLKPLGGVDYYLIPIVGDTLDIKGFVESTGLGFRLGHNFYQLTKTESIQPQKEICILERKTGKVYSGVQARGILGLPDMEVRVKPDFNREYDVFVQSTSVNRKLIVGTKLLILK